ncbi:hypothetical protein HML84_04035 [Alcanivorax sp. IO_7]|nr:hypothetical protein HML84_04035 [Alcanivorax sp. IO_7]
MERALARALSARPEDRFHDVAELRAALRRPGPVPRPPAAIRRRGFVCGGVSAWCCWCCC